MAEKYLVFEEDESGYSKWFQENPNGFVLNTNRPPRAKYMVLHTASCHTITIPSTQAKPDPFTTRKYMKICAIDPSALLIWMEANGATQFSKLCAKCNVTGSMDGERMAERVVSDDDGVGWRDEELCAAVVAYLEMQRKERAGEVFSKKQQYEQLAQVHGRSAKAFEYRMQNISYVLSLMGRDWLKGLKPAKNVGARVAAQIENGILMLSQSPQAPVVAFELEVRENLANPWLSEPVGSSTPESTQSYVTQFKRDPAVKAWVLKAAAGVCECCGSDAPFLGADGQPFLEVHHVRKLAEGGSDTTGNAVAVCPNCHRAMHYGADAKARVIDLYNKLTRLIPE